MHQWPPKAAGAADDERSAPELRPAVARLRRALAALPAEFPDRGVAEQELAAVAELAATAGEEGPDVPRLRRSLLLIAGAIGSVSALAPELTELRRAVDALSSSGASDPGPSIPGEWGNSSSPSGV